MSVPNLEAHLQAIITSITHLNELLEKERDKQIRQQGLLKKYFTDFVRERKEQEIVGILHEIERDKIALLLSITAETYTEQKDTRKDVVSYKRSSIQGKCDVSSYWSSAAKISRKRSDAASQKKKISNCPDNGNI